MNKSETIAELATALCAAQATMDFPRPDSANPAFKRDGRTLRYASLLAVIEATRPALTANGLSLVQTFEPTGPEVICITTTLLHTSGEWLSGTCSFPVERPGPQGYASASTYARRYSLLAMLGIVADEDDDGNAASQPGERVAAQARPPASRPESRGDAQAATESDHSGTGHGERQAIITKIGELFRVAHPGETFREWAQLHFGREMDRLPTWDLADLQEARRFLGVEAAALQSGKAGAPPAQVQGA